TLHNHDIATTENYKTCFYVLDSNETDIEKSAQTAIWCRTRVAPAFFNGADGGCLVRAGAMRSNAI
ncbi:MAG: hypothetical protein KBB19_13465, partial [Giesbergeria sp.]|nr:hypothetical protein [Giesbergeria sp.]MBP7084744.1 hypothetical protein [Giesbergeria sp.]